MWPVPGQASRTSTGGFAVSVVMLIACFPQY